MKDLRQDQTILFQTDGSQALKRVQAALEFLWEDKTHSIHDKVAGDFDYEELIAALLCAEKELLDSKEPEDD